MAYVPTGIWNVQKLLQRVEETTYGAKVTSSPSYSLIGLRTYIKENSKAAAERYRKEGSRDIYEMIKYGELHSFSLRYGMIDTGMLRYGTELPSGSGTIEKSLNLLYSKLIDNSGTLQEQYKFYLGCRCDMTEIEIVDGVIGINQNWICKEITSFSSSSGLTTPTHSSTPTAAAWSSASSGSNPLSVGGTNYDVPRAKMTVNMALEMFKPNGEEKIKMLWPTNRSIAFEFDTWQKGTVLFDAVKALTNYSTVTYALHSTGPKNITFTNLKLDEFEVTEGASDGKHTIEKLKGSSHSVAVTA